MRNFSPLLLLLLLTQSCLAQPGIREKTDAVTKLVQQFYNKNEIEKLYDLGGNSFKSALTFEAFKDATSTIQKEFGTSLNSYDFVSMDGKVIKYKASFTKAPAYLYVGLDTVDKLETLFVGEFTAEISDKAGDIPFVNPLATSLDHQVDSLAQAFIRKGNTVGLAIGVLKDGKTYTYGYGETTKGSSKVPDANTLFEIGSISKTFTATLLACMIEEKKISLDDPINKYLPDSIPALQYNGKPITIASLSNHSSGLPRLPGNLFVGADGSNPYAHYDEKRLFGFLKQYKPNREPGARYEYSNLAVGLLGVILERVSGLSYEELNRKLIWQPLQMNGTAITIGKKDSARFAQGYDDKVKPAHSWEFKSLSAAGSIRSSVHDMLLYAKAQGATGNSVLQKAIALTHQLTYEQAQQKVGLGWHITKEGSKTYIAHGGGTGGYRTFLVVNPETQVAVVALTNANVDPGSIGVSLIKAIDK